MSYAPLPRTNIISRISGYVHSVIVTFPLLRAPGGKCSQLLAISQADAQAAALDKLTNAVVNQAISRAIEAVRSEPAGGARDVTNSRKRALSGPEQRAPLAVTSASQQTLDNSSQGLASSSLFANLSTDWPTLSGRSSRQAITTSCTERPAPSLTWPSIVKEPKTTTKESITSLKELQTLQVSVSDKKEPAADIKKDLVPVAKDPVNKEEKPVAGRRSEVTSHKLIDVACQHDWSAHNFTVAINTMESLFDKNSAYHHPITITKDIGMATEEKVLKDSYAQTGKDSLNW